MVGTELESSNSVPSCWFCVEIRVKDGKKRELWGWNEARDLSPTCPQPVPIRVTPKKAGSGPAPSSWMGTRRGKGGTSLSPPFSNPKGTGIVPSGLSPPSAGLGEQNLNFFRKKIIPWTGSFGEKGKKNPTKHQAGTDRELPTLLMLWNFFPSFRGLVLAAPRVRWQRLRVPAGSWDVTSLSPGTPGGTLWLFRRGGDGNSGLRTRSQPSPGFGPAFLGHPEPSVSTPVTWERDKVV